MENNDFSKTRYAVHLHFSSWCQKRGIRYPISEARLEELYAMDAAGFRNTFREIAAGTGYPVQDAEKLFADGPENDPPISICCQAAETSINDVRELLFP